MYIYKSYYFLNLFLDGLEDFTFQRLQKETQV